MNYVPDPEAQLIACEISGSMRQIAQSDAHTRVPRLLEAIDTHARARRLLATLELAVPQRIAMDERLKEFWNYISSVARGGPQ